MKRFADVVVAVLIVLLSAGLTVAAIARVREAAARLSCTTKLKQLGFSIKGYGDSYDQAPPAMPNPALHPEQRLSWIVAIVPFVEAGDIYSRIDKDKGWEAEENRFAALMRLRYLECPGFPQVAPVSTLAPTDYVGVAGLGADAAAMPKGDPNAGLFGYDREVSPKDIQGSASNLLIVAETSRVQGAWTADGARVGGGRIAVSRARRTIRRTALARKQRLDGGRFSSIFERRYIGGRAGEYGRPAGRERQWPGGGAVILLALCSGQASPFSGRRRFPRRRRRERQPLALVIVHMYRLAVADFSFQQPPP